jgi:hypothetical protein
MANNYNGGDIMDYCEHCGAEIEVNRIDPKRLNLMKKSILKLDKQGLSMDEWITAASAIDPLIEDVLSDRIWCGDDGRINEQLGASKFYLTMGWHNNGLRTKVEWCYIS